MTAGTAGSATKSSPIADPRSRVAAGVLGLRLFLLSLGIFFAVAGHLQATLDELGVPAEVAQEVMTIAASTHDDVLNV